MGTWAKRRSWVPIAMMLFLYLAFICIRAATNVYTDSKSELRSAAKKLGVEPTLDGITGYIEESIEVGMHNPDKPEPKRFSWSKARD